MLAINVPTQRREGTLVGQKAPFMTGATTSAGIGLAGCVAIPRRMRWQRLRQLYATSRVTLVATISDRPSTAVSWRRPFHQAREVRFSIEHESYLSTDPSDPLAFGLYESGELGRRLCVRGGALLGERLSHVGRLHRLH